MKSILRKIWRPKSTHSVPAKGTSELTTVDLSQKVPDATEEQIETILAVQHQTMTSPERILALCQSIEYIVHNKIPGAIVECGVWRGGSMAAAARSLAQSGSDDRELWMYDTFEGMSEPTLRDVDFMGNGAAGLLDKQDPNEADSIWCRSPLEEVEAAMKATYYPQNKIKYIKGKVEQTLPQQRPEQIALLRLDTDWYESTRCELEYLFPLLAPGGVLIVDDYGHWNGCREAVDEYFLNYKIPMLLNRIDYTGRIGVKTVTTAVGESLGVAGSKTNAA